MRRATIALVVGFIGLLSGQLTTAARASDVDRHLPHYRPRVVAVPASASYLTPDGRVAVVGYNDMKEMLEAVDAFFERTHPAIRFALNLKGTRTAPPALAAGTSLFAPMGAEFSDSELADYRRAVASEPVAFRVAHDSLDPHALSAPLAIFVPAANPLRMLTLEQVARVFTERTDTEFQKWSELGLSGEWAERSVHPYGLGSAAALGIFMQRHVLGGRPFRGSFIGLSQSADVVQRIGEDPLAIGFAAMNRATSAVRVVPLVGRGSSVPSRGSEKDLVAGRYPLDRHLLIYVRVRPGGALDPIAREYLRLLLSREGQHIIATGSLGYLPLNPREIAIQRAQLEALP